jgi:hypothetical protein
MHMRGLRLLSYFKDDGLILIHGYLWTQAACLGPATSCPPARRCNCNIKIDSPGGTARRLRVCCRESISVPSSLPQHPLPPDQAAVGPLCATQLSPRRVSRGKVSRYHGPRGEAKISPHLRYVSANTRLFVVWIPRRVFHLTLKLPPPRAETKT